MKCEYIRQIINGEILVNIDNDIIIENFEIDSRNIKKGDCFIAINTGYKYIEDAIKNGASLIITEKNVGDFDVNTILVGNTILALSAIAHEIRKQNKDIKVIAITGSVGKTTTKELLSSVLENNYNVLKTIGNDNNEIGVPKTLLKLKKGIDVCVVELGMNHLKEISYLSKTIEPNSAIITNIGSSHIGYLNNKRNILKAKSEIIDGMNDGILYLNGDDKYLKKIKYKNKEKIGLNKNNIFQVHNIVTTKKHLYFNIKYNNRIYNVVFNIPSKSLINNILLVMRIGLDYKIPIEKIIDSIESYQPLLHRNNILTLNDNTILIDDCYNSSFESLKSGLETISNYNQDKIIIVGDILELGKHSKKIHKKIGKLLKKIGAKIILVGKEIRWAYKNNMIWCDNNIELMNLLNNIDLNNKVIYIKASRRMKLEEIREYVVKRGCNEMK